MIIKIKITKKQRELLQPLQDAVKTNYKGIIIAQINCGDNSLRALFIEHKEAVKISEIVKKYVIGKKYKIPPFGKGEK